MADHSPETRKRARPSFIWPIILITIGVIFLLTNLGVVQDNFWNMIWQWWPVLIIAIGLDSLFRRNDIAGPVFLIGLGIVILGSNIGLIGWGAWDILWRLWPVLLVAIGLEILVGRRSLWVSVLLVAVILISLGGVLWVMGFDTPSGDVLGGASVDQAIGEIKTADIEVNPAVGLLDIDSLLGTTALVQGQVNARGSSNVYTDFQIRGEKGYFKINSRPFNNIFSTNSWNWDLSITRKIPIYLVVSMGAGDMNLDLTGFELTGVDISQGVGEVTLILQDSGSYQVEVSQAIGSITIKLPQDTGVRIKVDRAITNLDLPMGYNQQGEYYYSPDYESMDNKIFLQLNQAIGNIEVRN